jgi:hypothetical protein
MTKVFNYWAMRDKVDKIGIVTDRIVLAKRTCCSLLTFVLSSHCLTALLSSRDGVLGWRPLLGT